VKMNLPEQVTAQAKRDQEYGQIYKQIESATRAVFGVLSTAKERNDLPLTLEALDRLIALIELRGKLASTFVPAANGTAPEESAKVGGGGDG
jgi:hypothetical protein